MAGGDDDFNFFSRLGAVRTPTISAAASAPESGLVGGIRDILERYRTGLEQIKESGALGGIQPAPAPPPPEAPTVGINPPPGPTPGIAIGEPTPGTGGPTGPVDPQLPPSDEPTYGIPTPIGSPITIGEDGNIINPGDAVGNVPLPRPGQPVQGELGGPTAPLQPGQRIDSTGRIMLTDDFGLGLGAGDIPDATRFRTPIEGGPKPSTQDRTYEDNLVWDEEKGEWVVNPDAPVTGGPAPSPGTTEPPTRYLPAERSQSQGDSSGFDFLRRATAQEEPTLGIQSAVAPATATTGRITPLYEDSGPGGFGPGDGGGFGGGGGGGADDNFGGGGDPADDAAQNQDPGFGSDPGQDDTGDFEDTDDSLIGGGDGPGDRDGGGGGVPTPTQSDPWGDVYDPQTGLLDPAAAQANPDVASAILLREQWKDYEERFKPVEEDLIRDVSGAGGAAGVTTAGDRAQVETLRATARSRAQTNRQLRATGTTLSQDEREGLRRRQDMQLGLNLANTQNLARRQRDATNTQTMSDLVNIGRGVSAQAQRGLTQAGNLASARSAANEQISAGNRQQRWQNIGTVAGIAMMFMGI
jgi:hypothetical protein